MLIKRIISTLLAVIMLMSVLVITVGAEDASESTPKYTYNTSNTKPSMDYLKGTTWIEPAEDGKKDETTTQEAEPIDTPEKKLATMDLRLEKDGYRLYVDAYSGEVATYCIATGEILFSNPYGVGLSNDTDAVKKELLSQLVVKYTNITTGESGKGFYSFEETIQGEGDDNPYPASQIAVKNIKNGLRIEYSIGREEARMLVPRQIEKSAFETKILEPLAAALEKGTEDFTYKKLKAYYTLKDTSTLTSEEAIKDMQKTFPITKKMAVYVLDATTATTEMAKLEIIIKENVQSYTYEELDEDHMTTEYESEDQNPPLFKMALEYTLDEYGMSVRLPANGIRFNETLYQLDSIDILPYMGAGKNPNAGYTFFPDGSGALFDFEKISSLGTSTTVTGKVYGQDYAYHTITGTHQEIIRYPVFGIKETETFEVVDDTTTGDTTTGDTSTGDGTATASTDTDEDAASVKTTEKDRGFIAIVEEGDALMELSTYHEVRKHQYNTVRMTVYPRPQDTYNIADAISVGSNDTWTVVSSRKYTGNYKVRYIMLTDPDVAAEKGIEKYYDCSYVGMAKAYRDYLERTGTLTRLTAEDVNENNIPIYIETFGAIETTKKILSIPVTTMAPLTSFENIKTMYNELSEKGVNNINFILTGYTKGGMSSATVPYNLKWDSSVGGNSGFEDLLTFASDKAMGIYPDFDFVFISNNTLFDGISLKSHAVKTIDNRYTSKRVYSATKQTYISYFELAVSPAYFSRFYEKLTENYLEYNPTGISVSTLGTYLNSDFDEDEPYNRADSQYFTVGAFEYLDKNYKNVMTSGGNAYSWKYVDHITDISLDSSRYAQSAASIPFLGIVLHGYVEFAGSPINMEGNIDYALLKAIENGASINFILSYQNTNILKESEYFSQYYSVRYDIWFNDVVSIYNELNSVLKGVQTSIITNHQFINGERVPDADELLADARAELEEAIKKENDLAIEKAEEARRKLLEARLGINSQINDTRVGLVKYASDTSENNKTLLSYSIDTDLANADDAKLAWDNAIADEAAKKLAYEKAVAERDELMQANPVDADALAAKNQEVVSTKSDYEAATKAIATAKSAYDASLGTLRTKIETIYAYANAVASSARKADKTFVQASEYLAYVKEHSDFSAAIIAELTAIVDGAVTLHTDTLAISASAKAYAESAYTRTVHLEGLDMKPYEEKGDIVQDEPKEEIVEKEVVSKYASDENKIVLVTYENGTSFILNFNNYDVTTKVEGVVYTVSAYGYVVLK